MFDQSIATVINKSDEGMEDSTLRSINFNSAML
jgi:hypothetical protein